MPAPLPHNPVFDELFASAVPLVTSGEHHHDVPPADGGRWPVTVVCIPPRPVRDRLEELMRAGLRHAGPGHFLTGRPDNSHLTVRALEPYREAAAPDDAVRPSGWPRWSGRPPPLRRCASGSPGSP